MKSAVAIVMLLVSLSCKSPKKTEAMPTNQKTNDGSSTVVSPEKNATLADIYRVTVSFISIGSGTDQEGDKILNAVLDAWNKKTGKTLKFDKIPWGREGECDFGFLLRELSESDKLQFIKDLKEAFKGRELVQILENHPNRFKGQSK